MVVEHVRALRDARGPLGYVADDGGATGAVAVADIASGVINLRSRHRGRDRCGLFSDFESRRRSLLLLAGQVHLPHGADAFRDGGLVLGRITGVDVLGEVRHFHRQHEDGKCDGGEDADDEGI